MNQHQQLIFYLVSVIDIIHSQPSPILMSKVEIVACNPKSKRSVVTLIQNSLGYYGQ